MTADLSGFAGESVTVSLATEGDATLGVESLQITVDSDGDDLVDAYERRASEMAVLLPRVTDDGRPGLYDDPLQLSPTTADSDGDGLVDGQEIEFAVREVNVDGGGTETRLVVAGGVSHPNLEDSDVVGRSDGAELSRGSNPTAVERVTATALVPTVAELEDGRPVPDKVAAARQHENVNFDLPLANSTAFLYLGPVSDILGIPKWVPDDYELEIGDKYHKLSVYVHVGVSPYVEENIEEYREDLPYEYSLTFRPYGGEPTWGNGVRGNISDGVQLGPGVHEVGVVLPVSDDSASLNQFRSLIGRMRLHTFVNESSVFYPDQQTESVTVSGDRITKITSSRYVTNFRVSRSFREALGIAHEALQKTTTVASTVTAGVTAGATFVLTKSVRATVIAFFIERLTPGTGIVSRAVAGATGVFMTEERLEEIRESVDDDSTFVADSGVVISLQA